MKECHWCDAPCVGEFELWDWVVCEGCRVFREQVEPFSRELKIHTPLPLDLDPEPFNPWDRDDADYPADWMMLRWEVYRNHTNYEPLMDAMLGRSCPEIWEVFVNRVLVNGRPLPLGDRIQIISLRDSCDIMIETELQRRELLTPRWAV